MSTEWWYFGACFFGLSPWLFQSFWFIPIALFRWCGLIFLFGFAASHRDNLIAASPSWTDSPKNLSISTSMSIEMFVTSKEGVFFFFYSQVLNQSLTPFPRFLLVSQWANYCIDCSPPFLIEERDHIFFQSVLW